MAVARIAHRQAQFTGLRVQRTGLRSSVALNATHTKFILNPTGDGNTNHIAIDEVVPPTKAVTLKAGVVEVGRARPAEVLIPAPTVSSRHAIIRIEEDTLYVTDLNSTNGTSVNGVDLAPMTAAQLKDGDEVIFGDLHLAKFKIQVVVVPDVYTTPLPEDVPAEAAPAAVDAAEAASATA